MKAIPTFFRRYTKNILFLACITCLLVSCGYQPVSRYAKSIFHDGVYVELEVNPSMPEASVSVKDSIHNAIIKRFGSSLKSKESAQSTLKVNVLSITQSPIAYDTKGFVSYYRTNIVLQFHFHNSHGVDFSVSNSGFYDYNANYTSTIVLDQSRLDSVSNAASQALDKFIAQVAYYGEFYNENE